MGIMYWSSDVCSSVRKTTISPNPPPYGRAACWRLSVFSMGVGATMMVSNLPALRRCTILLAVVLLSFGQVPSGQAQIFGQGTPPDVRIGRASCRERVCQYV